MSKKINIASVLIFTVFCTILFFLNGCESSNGPETENDIHYSFSYEIYDKHGELTATVTDKQINEHSIKTSAGYFGTDFLPPWLLESISENSQIDPDNLKENQIYLHSEANSQDELPTYTLRFRFPNMEQWQTGEYHLPKISTEEHLEFLRFMWEIRQNSPFPGASFESLEEEKLVMAKESDSSEKLAAIDYSESGFITGNSYGVRIDSTSSYYLSTEGMVEITEVDENKIKGNFNVELAGFPMKALFFSDEFPDDPQFDTFTITGNFTVIRGDYYDLVEGTENPLQ